ncbi:Peptidase S46 [Fodinibius salinus]|uniref:Dipeptidyl-peptidase n=1 Tax=Fodinibius salinus TaxID=860790 RepID=A0A5D3YKF0_9BACT|nr:S46 family peptidase [Fodinibius salinus]TYP93965.1 Peptidase S46 [Fodinibius salinus]
MNQSRPSFALSICSFLIAVLLCSACSPPSSLSSSKPLPPPTYEIRDTTQKGSMWLLPQVNGTVHNQMKKNGLNIDSPSIYSPEQPSLSQAVVQINTAPNSSASGSFVSPDGLVLTNYYPALEALSSSKDNVTHYRSNGFYAGGAEDEIPLPGITLRITIEQRDVTDQINKLLADSLTYREEQKQIQQIKKQLINKRKQDNKNLKVEINDLWAGNQQYMSVYKVIRDVRLVQMPPEAIARFGGISSNWKWPQYSASFSFLRAYVSPEGKSQTYQSSNVPFTPAKHLNISNEMVSTDDFTFTLSFPGQTFRNKSSYGLNFYQNIRNPVLTKLYHSILDAQQFSNQKQTKPPSLSKISAADNLTYYYGIQQGFEQYHPAEQKRVLEQQFKNWTEQDSLREIKYRRVLSQLEQAYNIRSQTGDMLYALVYPLNNSKLLEIAGLYDSYREYISDSTNTEPIQAKKDSLLTKQQQILQSINIDTQRRMLANMLHVLATLPEGKVMFYLLQQFGEADDDKLKEEIRQYLKTQQEQSIIFNTDNAKKFVSLPAAEARKQPVDAMVKLYQEIVDTYRYSRKNYMQHFAYLRPAQRRYQQGMLTFLRDSTLYPDANGTLRLSSGTVRGVTTSSTNYTPFSNFRTLSDSTLSKLPPSLKKDTSKIPRPNFLTTNDITGGSRGAPILNTDGQLIGLAYDRNLQAAAGDYFYDPKLNRTINVNVQYIRYLLDQHFSADRLLKELKE